MVSSRPSLAGSARVKFGDAIVLNANLSGSTPMFMQWDKGGRIIQGSSASSIVVESASRKDVGLYSLYATNDFGTAYMGIFDVSVQVPQLIDPLSISQSGVTISFNDVDGSFLYNYNEMDFIVYRSQDLVTWTAITNAVLKSNTGKRDPSSRTESLEGGFLLGTRQCHHLRIYPLISHLLSNSLFSFPFPV